MNIFIAATLGLWMAVPACATTSALVRTYQPFGMDRITIEPVTCYAWNAQIAVDDALLYISAKNEAPNFSKTPVGDLNLASTSHLSFSNSESGTGRPMKVVMKADEFVITEGYTREDIVKACLECVRRVLPEKLRNTPLTFSASPENKAWMSKIVDEFNQHDRSKVFYGAEP
ncbi:hypothetical protein [Prosthecobacter sp.]|uniref:hypothetical protein n=1 Tax=Prosthecobacter sp. TaxID=1965333 RepID=UPI0024872E90|nr:hypothetical protein [Prosthecobacter sp.]MDI1312596.1 hypothetical protein [Prosthecobacter sp.]